jgi:hypothetical protein
MSWSIAIFCAGISLAVAALLKYGTIYLIARKERAAIAAAMRVTIKEDMKDVILDRIDYAVTNTLSGLLYNDKTIKILDKEGKTVGFIRRATKVETSGTTDHQESNADR